MDGYKTFHKGMKNRYGKPFKEGNVYQIQGPLKFGNDGNGFHFCMRLEDTLRYFPAMEEEVDIAKVSALGELEEYKDEYYGYYDMFCTNIIQINHVMTREEIIKMFLDMPEYRVVRFISGFHLTKEEIELFRLRYASSENIQDAISYYQEGKTDTYEKKIEDYKKKVYTNRKKN